MLMMSAHLHYALAQRILKSPNYGVRVPRDLGPKEMGIDTIIMEVIYNTPWWLVRPCIQIGALLISAAVIVRILPSRKDGGAATWLPVIIACFTGIIPKQCGI